MRNHGGLLFSFFFRGLCLLGCKLRKKIMEFNPHDGTHDDATKVLFEIRFCSCLGTLEAPTSYFDFFSFCFTVQTSNPL